VGVRDGVGEAVMVGLAVGVGVPEGSGVSVGDGLGVRVDVGEGNAVGLGVGGRETAASQPEANSKMARSHIQFK
jgi:hypothetical protein